MKKFIYRAFFVLTWLCWATMVLSIAVHQWVHFWGGNLGVNEELLVLMIIVFFFCALFFAILARLTRVNWSETPNKIRTWWFQLAWSSFAKTALVCGVFSAIVLADPDDLFQLLTGILLAAWAVICTAMAVFRSISATSPYEDK